MQMMAGKKSKIKSSSENGAEANLQLTSAAKIGPSDFTVEVCLFGSVCFLFKIIGLPKRWLENGKYRYGMRVIGLFRHPLRR